MNGLSFFGIFKGIFSLFYHAIRISYLGSIGAANTRAAVTKTYCDHRCIGFRATRIAVQYSRLFGGIAIIVSILIGFGIGRASGKDHAKYSDSRTNVESISNSDVISSVVQHEPDSSITDIRGVVSEIREARQMAFSDPWSPGYFYTDERGACIMQIGDRKFEVIEIYE